MTRLVQGNDQSGSREAVYGFDVSGEHLTSITDTGGGVTTLAWDPGSGDLASVTEPGGLVTVFDYDGSHRVVSVSQGLAGDTPAVTRLAYPSGSSTLVAGPTTDQGQAVAQVAHTSYTLNAGDRPTTVVDELGRTRQAGYTPFADVSSATDGTGATTSAAYGANGGESLTKVTSPTGGEHAAGLRRQRVVGLPADQRHRHPGQLLGAQLRRGGEPGRDGRRRGRVGERGLPLGRDRGTTWVKHGTRWNDTTTGAWTTTDPITHLNGFRQVIWPHLSS